MNNILENQNRPDLIRLLKAQRVAYADIKKFQLGFELIALVVAMTLPVIYIFLPEYKTVPGMIGSGLSLLAIVVDRLQKNRTKEAASIQEQFDRELFEIDANIYDGIATVSIDRIVKLSRRYKKDDMQDWYSKYIYPHIPHNLAVLLCQKANLHWDVALRKRYRLFIVLLMIIYLSLFCFAVANSFEKTTEFLFHFTLLIASGAALIKYCIGVFLEKGDIINEKNSLNINIDRHFDEYKKMKVQPSKEQLSQIQTVIFNSRKRSVKIPGWFYRLFKSKQEADMDDIVEGIKVDFLPN